MASWLDRGVTYVSGSAPVGVYAADGTFNVVESDPNVFTGLYHPCGAFNVTVSTQTNPPVYAPNGSLYLPSNTPGALPTGFGAASLYHDYTVSKYYGGPAPSITRASDKTVLDNAGLLSTVASGALALSDRGLSIEESRTNVIRNNTMQGAAVGSPGTLPTSWQDLAADITRQVVGTGTENGIDYIDVRFAGIPAGTGPQLIRFDATGTASIGETWTNSVFVKLQAGSLTNVDLAGFVLRAANEGGGTVFAPSGTLTRIVNTRTLASTNQMGAIRWNYLDTVTAVDFTLRIGLPQSELGTFASSPIRTSGATATRAADATTIPSPTSYVSLAQGGAFVEWTEGVGVSGIERRVALFVVDVANFIRLRIAPDGAVWVDVLSGGVQQANFTWPTPVVAGTTYQLAVRWAANDFAVAASANLGGTSLQIDASGAVPVGASPTFGVGQNSLSGSQQLNGIMKRLALWQTGPSNAELQALVA